MKEWFSIIQALQIMDSSLSGLSISSQVKAETGLNWSQVCMSWIKVHDLGPQRHTNGPIGKHILKKKLLCSQTLAL